MTQTALSFTPDHDNRQASLCTTAGDQPHDHEDG